MPVETLSSANKRQQLHWASEPKAGAEVDGVATFQTCRVTFGIGRMLSAVLSRRTRVEDDVELTSRIRQLVRLQRQLPLMGTAHFTEQTKTCIERTPFE